MANVMLSTYPETFAGGAIIGGLPYGVATSVGEAFERMQGRNPPSITELQSKVRGASMHSGPWPKISVWHGTHDQTVKSRNAEQTVTQWQGVHGVGSVPDRVENVNGHGRKVWLAANGEVVIESFAVQGMAHGVPLATTSEAPLGQSGPFMLEAGISSTARIAQHWGLAEEADVMAAEAGTARQTADIPGNVASLRQKASAHRKAGSRIDDTDSRGSADGISKVINNALRAAGLLR
jgi:poly(3-hydroxybutyrate) depolymerase